MISRVGQVTADDLLKLSDGKRYELIEGALRGMSPAGSEHGRVAMRIGRRLDEHVENHQLGQTFAAETGFRIASNPDTVRAPDAAFVSNEALGSVEKTSGYLPLAPDLIVEVVSPHDKFSDVESKVAAWLAAGTKIALVADPQNTTLHVYREADKIDILHLDDEFDGDDAVPGWKLQVRDAFGIE